MTFREIFVHFKPLVILFLAVIATSIYRMIDKVMLGWYSDMSNLGSYEYADRMIKLVITLITALGTVMLPRRSALYAEGKDEQAARYMNSTSQFMFVMAFALAFGLAGIADEFMPTLLGPGYEGSVILTKVLCISLPIMGWNNLVRTQGKGPGLYCSSLGGRHRKYHPELSLYPLVRSDRSSYCYCGSLCCCRRFSDISP